MVKKLQYKSFSSANKLNEFLKTIYPSDFKFAVAGDGWSGVFYTADMDESVPEPEDEPKILTPEDIELDKKKVAIANIKKHRDIFINKCMEVLRVNMSDICENHRLTDDFTAFIIYEEPHLQRIELIPNKRKIAKKKHSTKTLEILYGLRKLDHSNNHSIGLSAIIWISDIMVVPEDKWKEIKKAFLLIKKYAPLYLITKYDAKLEHYGKEVKICEGCGHESDYDGNFCSYCGEGI